MTSGASPTLRYFTSLVSIQCAVHHVAIPQFCQLYEHDGCPCPSRGSPSHFNTFNTELFTPSGLNISISFPSPESEWNRGLDKEWVSGREREQKDHFCDKLFEYQGCIPPFSLDWSDLPPSYAVIDLHIEPCWRIISYIIHMVQRMCHAPQNMEFHQSTTSNSRISVPLVFYTIWCLFPHKGEKERRKTKSLQKK